MNIKEIKECLGYQDLNLNTATDKDGKPSDWMRHWDNDQRIAVSLHKDTVTAIQSDEPPTTLGLQEEVRTAEESGKEYTAKRIVMYEAPEVVL